MRYKVWVYACAIFVVVVLVRGQERFDIFEEKNEIPYEKDKTKMSKTSSKPILVIKEPQSDTKTSTLDIKEQTLKILVSEEKYTTPQTLDGHDTKTPTVEEKLTVEPTKPQILICPPKNEPKPLFSLPCFATSNCGFLGKDLMCCDGRCVKGVPPPKTDPIHEPIFFGIIERKCPVDPLTELSEVKECFTDDDCSPRICCGEILPSGTKVRFCRTPIPVWDSLPLPSPVLEPLKVFTSYMQCTPPPPPHLDLYPKSCQNPMDCFPSLCCQEKGKKFCRPPKRSLLALVAELGQRIIPEDAARKFIEKIS
ncbi:unnamed protein product [Ceutorhynchus assimilis]|uniref:WAP domain-containing protein n=1 Tax=Ceutorhynchus assimilis TaxID=467358 RepID=A0A9N9MCR8_9CUCU|nr:unnamed protein product [Ceutorhynchus assimilis]